jgi:hypothetical protein
MSPAREPNPGEVLLRAFLSTFFYFVLGGGSALVTAGLANAVNALYLLVPVVYFLVPVISYVMSLKRLTPEKSKGLGIGLALFMGLTLLIPLVICGGFLAFGKL